MNTEKNFQEITLANIQPSPMNPRKTFEGKKFDELVASVRKVGVIEPILVRPMSDDLYEIVAGERRFRASCLIASGNGGLEKHLIPAMVQEMSDDEAFDLMTIENLQREDLNELEEAQGFKVYLDKKGKEALPELAERTGINPQYISRRLMVLTLPSKVLKAWEKGEIKYGHCEQLCRLKDKKLIIEYLDRLLITDAYNRIETVKQLKAHIDEHAIPLKSAKFNKDEAGCLTCQSNTECQSQLFEEKSAGAYCTNAVCFRKNQSASLTENWRKYGKQFGTNGFRFYADLTYGDYHEFGWQGDPGEKCKECAHFVTILGIDGKVSRGDKQSCVGDKSCYDQIIKEGRAADRKESGNNQETSPQDPDAPRVSWHGQHFREEFYKTRIPEAISTLQLEDIRCLQLSLLSILESNGDSVISFARQWLPEYADKENLISYNIDMKKVWQKVFTMHTDEIMQAHRDIAGTIIMQAITFTPDDRHRVAGILEIDLSKEWRITKEYLDKKTTKEILNMIAKFGIDKNEKALTYLYENLSKKRGRFDTCKKAELVSIFLDSGIDLAGLVPDEIINVK